MVRTMIGVDSNGVGCIKIMKSDSDNPRTTPDSARAKFLYNSKFDVQPSIWGFRNFQYAGGSGTNYVPAGSNSSNYDYVWEGSSGSGTNIYYVRAKYFGGLRYNMPLFDVKGVRTSVWPTIRYKQNSVYRKWSGKYYHDNGGYYATLGEAVEPWCENLSSGIGEYGTLNYGFRAQTANTNDGDPYNYSSTRRWTYCIWNFPGDAGPITDAKPLADTAGKRSVRITSTSLKIAKPGYDAATATGTELAFDSSLNGVKIIAAADIALPYGYSQYDTGITLPSNVIADVYFYKGTTPFYPANPDDLTYGADYYFEGSSIKFENYTSAGRARFMIYAADNSAPTSGSNKVLRQFTENGVDVVQFVRPGSANPPSFADIAIDTRWPAVQLLDEGYFAVTNIMAPKEIIVPNSAGMFLMVKYMTVHGAHPAEYDGFDRAVRVPFVKTFVLNYNGSGAENSCGDCTYCKIESGKVTFYTYRGRPGDYYQDLDHGSVNMRADPVPYPVNGIRYYILGIPAG